MIYSIIIFIVLIIVLSLMRTRLVFEMSGMSLLIFGSTRPGINFYSLFFLPGTIIHELSHWLVAEILQVRTGAITIFPDLEEVNYGNSQRLGSVATERTDPFRGFLIGIAPFISGLGILVVLGSLLSHGWDTNFLWWQLALIIYGIMVVGNSMMISESDRRTWPFIIILMIFIIFVVSKYYPVFFVNNQEIFLNMLKPLNQVLGMTAGLNLVMIVGSYGLRRLIQIITKKRLIHK